MSRYTVAPILQFIIDCAQPAPDPLDWRHNAGVVDQVAILESARTLATAISAQTGLSHDEAFRGLDRMPGNVLPLLETLEGWVLLSDQVALLFGIHSAWVEPTKH